MDELNKKYIDKCEGCYKMINLRQGKEVGRIVDDYDFNEFGYFCKECNNKYMNNNCEICANNEQDVKLNIFLDNQVICLYCLRKKYVEQKLI